MRSLMTCQGSILLHFKFGISYRSAEQVWTHLSSCCSCQLHLLKISQLNFLVISIFLSIISLIFICYIKHPILLCLKQHFMVGIQLKSLTLYTILSNLAKHFFYLVGYLTRSVFMFVFFISV